MICVSIEDHNVEEMDEFLCEIALMKTISRHPNVVALIGYCTVKQPMLIVMEFVGCGDLVSFAGNLVMKSVHTMNFETTCSLIIYENCVNNTNCEQRLLIEWLINSE